MNPSAVVRRLGKFHFRLWGTWAVLVGLFAVFKTSDAPGTEWYTRQLEVVAWVFTILACTVGLSFGVVWAVHWFKVRHAERHTSINHPVSQAPALADRPDLAEIERETKARNLSDERFLAWQRADRYLQWAINQFRSLEDSPVNGDQFIRELDRRLYRLLDGTRMPVFSAMYELGRGSDWDKFFVRPDAQERAIAVLEQLRKDARPWTITGFVTLDSFPKIP